MDWITGILLCRQNGNHSKEDLAKSGCKPNMKYKSLIILLYLWLHIENQNFKK
jgi:hypothetical protein